MILESRERAGRRPIGEAGDGKGVGIFEKFVVRSAVRGVWKILGEILLLGQTAELVRVIRILAILLCPAPENHPAVYRQCIAPFVRGFEKDVIKTATKERLDEILPSDWLSPTLDLRGDGLSVSTSTKAVAPAARSSRPRPGTTPAIFRSVPCVRG